jgi:coenzyme F420-0:L-glutamate ligase/coenzyme F420-1:gamma-L-glutamate ligase
MPSVRDGDVLAVTSKIVSKSEGRVVTASRAAAVEGEIGRVVASRGATVIVRTGAGLVLAAAGVDDSNVEPGRVALLPLDADRSARAIREQVAAICGVDVAVVITDTAGRAWRVGQTDIAIGCAGIDPLESYAGRQDPYGNHLLVTAPAVADELAAAADLVKGKTHSSPVAVVRGSVLRVLPRGQHGPGAAALVRDPAQDLFGLGSREAVAAAATRSDPAALAAFPVHLDPIDDLVERAAARLDPATARLRAVGAQLTGEQLVHGWVRGVGFEALLAAASLGAAAEKLCALAASSGWTVSTEPGSQPLARSHAPLAGWRAVLRVGLTPRRP